MPKSSLPSSKSLDVLSETAQDTAVETAQGTLESQGGQGSATLDALQTLGESRVQGRTGMMQAGMMFGIYRYIPYPLLMVLPFIREDTKQFFRAWRQRRRGETAPVDEAGTPTVGLPDQPAVDTTPSPYRQYRSFPALLPENAEIRGRRGRYRVGRYFGLRGRGRLYLGHEVNRRQPVVIREYLLPNRHFNPTEQRLTRDTFETIAGLKLADGREQDFRLAEPWDAMGDRQDAERCYLITTGAIDTYPTLRSVLAQQGAFHPVQVRQILNQGLQTLESLHGQKYSLPAGQVQTGLVHGNLSLDSLLLLPDATPYYEQPQLLVFLRDLFLWDSLFIPPPTHTQPPVVADDLVALGEIGFFLLAGRWVDDYGRRLRPHSPHVWPGTDLPLEQYLRQLLGLEEPLFPDAATARQALLALPAAPAALPADWDAVAAKAVAPKRRFPWWGWLLLIGGLGLLVALLLGWWWSRRQRDALAAPPLCCITDVPAVPPGQFNYAAANPGTWYPLWISRNLVTQDRSLEQVLEAQQPDLNLTLRPTSNADEAIGQVLQDQAEFAIAPLTQTQTRDLTATPIAYDGLVVFVAFSYIERDRGLPQHLQGQISLEQLRQLYTGEVRNWRGIGGPNLPVRLYLPTQPELVQLFEERVLQTPAAIATFRRQWNLDAPPTARFTTPIASDDIDGQVLPTFDMLRRVLQDFEIQPQIGSIGFANFSQVYGQCSVYPLAIAVDDDSAVQPLHYRNELPITPADDLCGDKGNYAPKQSLFADNTYPLAYPLGVFHRLDNSRVPIAPSFIEMMNTDEGQRLLGQTGLVPLRTVSDTP